MKRRIERDQFCNDIVNEYRAGTYPFFHNEEELRKKYGDEIFEAVREGTTIYLDECISIGLQNHHIEQLDFVLPLVDSVEAKSNGEIEFYDEFEVQQ